MTRQLRQEADADFLSVYHLIGQRHSTILLKHYLSSVAVCEEIKPDIFDINCDMPTGPVSPSLPPLDPVDIGPVSTRPLLPCPYHI